MHLIYNHDAELFGDVREAIMSPAPAVHLRGPTSSLSPESCPGTWPRYGPPFPRSSLSVDSGASVSSCFHAIEFGEWTRKMHVLVEPF